MNNFSCVKLDEEIEDGPRIAAAKALGALARRHLPTEQLEEVISAVQENLNSKDWGERQGAVSLLESLCVAADWERCGEQLGNRVGPFLTQALTDQKIPVRVGSFGFCAALAQAAAEATGNTEVAKHAIDKAKAIDIVAKDLMGVSASTNIELLSSALNAAGQLGGSHGDEARKKLMGPVFNALQNVPGSKTDADGAIRLLLCVEEGKADEILEMLSSSQCIQAKEIRYLTEYIRRVTQT